MRTLRESILDSNFDIDCPDANFPNAKDLVDLFLDNNWEQWGEKNNEADYYGYRLVGSVARAFKRDFKDFLMDLNHDLPNDAVRDTQVRFNKQDIELIQPLSGSKARKMVVWSRGFGADACINIQTADRYNQGPCNFRIPHEVIDVVIWCLENNNR